ncbi:MAG: phage portal protein [Pseudomonadota bacterium]
MQLPFGFQLTREKAAVAPTNLSPMHSPWSPFAIEAFTGAWQRDIYANKDTAVQNETVYACIDLIASDIAKLSMQLVEKSGDIWKAVNNPAYSPVIKKPNRYQNNIQFRQHWITSKLLYGNTYVLKVRDNRGVVVALYILDPSKVKVLEAPGASVFYKIQPDDLSTNDQFTTVPASEIIHDRMNTLFHPLVGVSPISTIAMAAKQANYITRVMAALFRNGGRPGGLLIAPQKIDPDEAKRLKEQFQINFGGDNSGKIAVLENGMTYKTMTISPVDSQVIEQRQMTQKQICTAFHVPSYKLGIGEDPKYSNAAQYDKNYLSNCLHAHIASFEMCLSEGLGLDCVTRRIDIVEDDLTKMDPQTQIETLSSAVQAKIFTPNEARARFHLPAKPGGDALYGQKQDHSLEALSKRDEILINSVGLTPAIDAESVPILESSTDDQDDDDSDDDVEVEQQQAFDCTKVRSLLEQELQ